MSGQSFDEILAECLEAVTSGRRAIDDCLERYPQHASRLAPLLETAIRLRQAQAVEPPPALQGAVRQRFLAAARSRQAAARPRRRLLPALTPWRWQILPSPAWRPLAAGLTASVLVAFLAFSSVITVTAQDSVPGDWQYPVKRLTERTRLAFTFGEDARRSYRIHLAEERLREVEVLARKGSTIDEPVLRDLVNHTEPLVRQLDPEQPAAVPPQDVQRIEVLTAKEQTVLTQVQPLVDDRAQDELAKAEEVSTAGRALAVTVLSLSEQAVAASTATATPSAVATAEATPGVSVAAPPTDTPAAAQPSPAATAPAAATPESTSVPEATATLAEGEPQPTATPEPPTPTPTPERRIVPLPDDTTGGIAWVLFIDRDFSVRMPAERQVGWAASTVTSGSDERVFVGHRRGSQFDAIVMIDVASGRASIQVLVNGGFRVVHPDEVAALVPEPVAAVINHVLESITIGP